MTIFGKFETVVTASFCITDTEQDSLILTIALRTICAVMRRRVG